jgi:hypothetical protein
MEDPANGRLNEHDEHQSLRKTFHITSQVYANAPARGLIWALAFVPMSIAIALLAHFLVSGLAGAFVFPELKSGYLAYFGSSKSAELVFVTTLWGALAAFYLFGASKFIKTNFPSQSLVFVLGQLTLSLLFIIPSLFSRIGSLSGQDSPLYFVALAQILALLGFLVSKRIARGVNRNVFPERKMDLFQEGIWFGIFALAWIPAAGILVFARWAGIISTTEPMKIQMFHIGLSVSTVGVALLAQFLAKNVLLKSSLTGIIIAAYGISALFLLLPPLLTIHREPNLIPGIDIGAWRLLFATLAALIIIETAWRFWLNRGSNNKYGAVSSLALAALAVSFRTGGGAPSISSDDYHFGEIFTPVYLFLEGGIENVGNMARGPMANLLPGIVNFAFFDGQASTMAYSLPLIALLSAAICHIAIREIAGLLPATVIVFTFGVANHYLEAEVSALVLVFVAISLISSRRNPVGKGFLIAALLSLSIFVYPMMGVAGTLLTLGVSFATVIGSYLGTSRDDLFDSAAKFLSAFASFMLLVLLDPIQQLHRSITYVITQAGSNTIAHGIPLDFTLHLTFDFALLLTLSFGIGVIVPLLLLVKSRENIRMPSRQGYYDLALLVLPLFFVVGLSGRFLGRIEPDMFSLRPLYGSLVTLGLVIPMTLFLVKKRGFRTLGFVFLGAGAMLSLVVSPILQSGFQRSLFGAVYQPGEWNSTSFNENIPALGLGNADPSHLGYLNNISQINEALRGMRIENLSNRNALNAYFGWPNAGDYIAPYNIPNTQEEVREILAITASDPDVIFLGPGTWHDGLSMTLRTPTLSAWLLENYTPVRCESSYWAVPSDIAGRTAFAKFPEECIGAFIPMEKSEIWAESIGPPTGLNLLPYAWARNEVETTPTGTVQLVEDDSEPGLTTLSAVVDKAFVATTEFLVIEASCRSGPGFSPSPFDENPQRTSSAQLIWNTEGQTGPSSVIDFRWGRGEFLVPVYAYPKWESSSGRDLKLEFRAGNGECAGGWEVVAKGVALEHLE